MNKLFNSLTVKNYKKRLLEIAFPFFVPGFIGRYSSCKNIYKKPVDAQFLFFFFFKICCSNARPCMC